MLPRRYAFRLPFTGDLIRFRELEAVWVRLRCRLPNHSGLK